MKKKPLPHPELKRTATLAEEAQAMYVTRSNKVKDLTYEDFKKVADKAGFTQAEWADILHISERTLQRYAKDNHSFAPGNAERFSLIEKVLQQSRAAFGRAETLYGWLNRKPQTPAGSLSMQSLHSFEGIQKVLDQLGRIQHGLFA